jgi:hypothetical protein
MQPPTKKAPAAKKKSAGKSAKPKAPRIVQLDPVKCAAHELLERITMRPALAAALAGDADYRDAAAGESAEWEAFCADVAMRGVQEPVRYIVRGGKVFIVDGRHRWQAALAAGLKSIPGIQVTEDKAIEIILGSVAHRRHMSKETVAYMTVIMYPHLAGGTRGRPVNSAKIAELDQTAEMAVCPPQAITRQSAALQVGCSLRLIEEACATFKVLSDKPSARKKLEPLIIGGIIGLGAARAGAAGGEASTDDNNQRRPSSYASVSRTLRSFTSQVREYDSWPADDREAMVVFLAARTAEWPEAFRRDFQRSFEVTKPRKA